jgi:uncharacterized integral membrane protein
MGNVWLKIKIWTKIILFSVIALYCLIFFLKNDETVTVWYFPFREKYEISLIWLALAAFAIGVIGTILVRTSFKTIRQIKDLRTRSRLEKLEREQATMKAKAAMLQVRTASSAGSSAPPASKPAPASNDFTSPP